MNLLKYLLKNYLYIKLIKIKIIPYDLFIFLIDKEIYFIVIILYGNNSSEIF